MTESQKVFASLSGAVIAHLLFFIVVFLFLGMESVSSSSGRTAPPEPEPPREVTVMLDELIEFAQLEPEPEPGPKPFVSTELNRAEDRAPENPRFESDRNTTAATELLPNEAMPQEYGPTLDGEEIIPNLELQNREFVEESAASSSVDPTVAQSASAPSPRSTQVGRDDENSEGQESAPMEEVADAARRPEVAETPGEDQKNALMRSFLDPNRGKYAVGAPTEMDEEDKASENQEESEEIGNRADEVQEKSMTAQEGVGEDQGDSTSDSASEAVEQMNADDGLFAADFSPEERKNVVNGSLTNIGQNAVDAEDTPMGRYQQSVRTAISKMWHRYRQDHADFVSWGTVKLQFRIDRNGNVKGLKITENKANSVLAEFSVKAIMDAELPPMPDEVAKEVGAAGMKMDYDIIIY